MLPSPHRFRYDGTTILPEGPRRMVEARLIAMSGSLRAGSFSNAILETMREKFAGRAEIQLYDLAPIPLYNQDFQGEKRPPVVKQKLAGIAEADRIVLCTPDVNHSI